MDELHFLRPIWLVGVVAAPVLGLLLWLRLRHNDPWRAICDLELLPFLRESREAQVSLVPFVVVGFLGAVGALALAGPAWDATTAQVHRSLRARVIALDLSRSMDAQDVAPSRMDLARAKAIEILKRTNENQIGLTVFAGDGFFITPLTSDASSLIGILPAFKPSVIVAQGSRPDLGLREAAWLVGRAGTTGGEIILITDGGVVERTTAVARTLREERGIRVSVLAVGTEAGAQIPLAGGNYLTNLQGRLVVATTPIDQLREVAEAGRGQFAVATQDNSDIDHLLSLPPLAADNDPKASIDREIKVWRDQGPWFVLALLPLAVLCFRRGWVIAVACVALLPSPPSQAQDMGEIPLPPSSAPTTAGAAGSHQSWRWSAIEHYRAEAYVEAAALFSQGGQAMDHYNRGNALAKAGFLRAAVVAYVEAIAREPKHADARFNRALVESLLEKQKERGKERGGRATADAEPIGGMHGPAGEGKSQSGGSAGGKSERERRSKDKADADSNPDLRGGTGANRGEKAGDVQGNQLDNESQRVEARTVKPGDAKLSPQDLERIEEVISGLVEDRLGLWRRKIEIQWRNNARSSQRAQSDAW